MKSIFPFALLIFLCACGTPDKKTASKNEDQFRSDVKHLQSAGFLKNIDPKKLDSLIAVYSADSSNGLKDLLCSNKELLKIHVTLNGRTLQEMYSRIADTIAANYPSLKADEIVTTLIPTDPGGHDTDWVVVKMRFGEKWYERKLYYLRKWEIDDFVYRIYNRKLADDGSPLRLHLVEYSCDTCGKGPDDYMGNTDVTRYGYMMLNKMQEDSLYAIEALDMEPENEFDIYTTAAMQAVLDKFEASGLNTAIGKAASENIRMNIMQSSLYSQQDVYDFLDTLISTTFIDTTNTFDPYEQILNSLSKISRGKFEPTDILDEPTENNSRNYQFGFEGDIYRFNAPVHGAWLFPGIIDNVNKALEDHHTGGAFYTVTTDKSTCRFIYIDDAMIEKVKASGLFGELQKGPSKELKDRWTAGR